MHRTITLTLATLSLTSLLPFITAIPLQARQQQGSSNSDKYTLSCKDDNGATFAIIGETPYEFCVAGPEAKTPTHCDDDGNIVTSVDNCKSACSCTPKTPAAQPATADGSTPAGSVPQAEAPDGSTKPLPASNPASGSPAPAPAPAIGGQQPVCGQTTLSDFGVTQDQASIVGDLGQTVQAWCTGSVVQGVCAKSNSNAPVAFQVKGKDAVNVCGASCSCT